MIPKTWKHQMFQLSNRVLKLNSNQKDTIQLNSKFELSEVIVGKILKNLEEFERNEKYLSKNIKIQELAIKLKTNDKYLSKTIKHFYHKKFVDYVNDLRIEYTVQKLKSNRRFRNYNIKYIADEVGFSNPISFSRAFEKKQGLKPSHFIKQLEEFS